LSGRQKKNEQEHSAMKKKKNVLKQPISNGMNSNKCHYPMLRNVCMKFLRMSAELRCHDGMANLKVPLRRLPTARLLAAVLPQLLLVSPALLLELLQLAVLELLPLVLLPPCFKLKRLSFVSKVAVAESSLP
jgi:hypothetical protein